MIHVTKCVSGQVARAEGQRAEATHRWRRTTRHRLCGDGGPDGEDGRAAASNGAATAVLLDKTGGERPGGRKKARRRESGGVFIARRVLGQTGSPRARDEGGRRDRWLKRLASCGGDGTGGCGLRRRCARVAGAEDDSAWTSTSSWSPRGQCFYRRCASFSLEFLFRVRGRSSSLIPDRGIRVEENRHVVHRSMDGIRRSVRDRSPSGRSRPLA